MNDVQNLTNSKSSFGIKRLRANKTVNTLSTLMDSADNALNKTVSDLSKYETTKNNKDLDRTGNFTAKHF